MAKTDPRRRRRLRWALAMLVMAVVMGYVGISILAAAVLTRPRNHPSPAEAADIGPGAVDWSTRTADGVTLRGWYGPTPGRRRLVVLVHGLDGCRDEVAAQARDLRARGFDVLLFDLRGHGSSDPSRVFMGGRERRDIRAALAWAKAEGYSPDRIGWLGQSMGASTLLMEGAENGDIRSAVFDSGFGDLPELLEVQLSRHSGLPRWFNPGILLAARLVFGVRTDDLVPIRSARTWGNRPALVIHGEADSIVPFDHGRRLAEALGSACRLVTLPGVEHVGGYWDDPTGYIDAVAGFFDRHLGR